MATQEKGISRTFRAFSKYASLIVLIIGGLGLCGWLFDIQNLKSVLPGLATMKVNTAISFILTGIALNLKYNEKPNSIKLGYISQSCGFIVTALALLTLGAYVFKQDLLIDQLIFKDPQTPDAFHPGRMSVTTAINFTLLGIALLMLNFETRRKIRPSQFLALIAGAIAFIALIGYLYGVESLYSIGIYSSMPLHTALGFAVLSIGVLCARPEDGIMEVVASDTVGGAILRRLLPIAIFILVVTGWLRLRGQQAGFYDTNFGLALMVMLSAASFSVVIWLNARWLNRIDSERMSAVDLLGSSEERYRRFFENMHETFIIQEVIADDTGKPIDLRFLDINPAGERFLGRARSELVGRSRSQVSGQPDPEGLEMASRVASTGTPFHMVRYSPGFGGWFESFTYSLGAGVVATLSLDITERKRAENALHESESTAHSLLGLSKKLERVETYSEALDAALDQVREILGYQNVWTYLLSDDKEYLRLLTITGEKSREITDDVPTLTIKGDRFLEEIVASNDIVLVEDARTDPRTNKDIVSQLGNRTIVNVPIILMDRHLGVFGTGSFGEEGVRVPSQTQLDYLRALASYMAVTFDRIHLLAKRRQADEALQKAHIELEFQIQERTAALSEANSLLQTLMDNIPDHIYFKDADSRFIRNSKSQAKMMGLSDPAKVIGKTDFDFFPQDHAQRSFDEEQKLVKSDQPLLNIEERVVWPDGRVTWVSTTKLPLRDTQNQVIGTFGISRDITERKRAEEELQRSNMQLQAANKELEAFSYSVSHDLRAPLRTIDGFSQAIMEDYGEQLPEQGRSDLTRVRKAAQHMAQLIDDLLNLSKVTRAPMKSVTVDLTKLTQGIIREFQRTQPERNVTFTSAPNLKIHGDPHLLQAMLENLLNNAWKFTSKRERAEIELGSKRENEEIIYFVRDNGAGFDMAYTSKLFGAFQRLHAMTDFPGTGVGLATVQRIIHRHGGRIWAEAEVDHGATFFFTLPALERAKSKSASREKDSIIERAKEII